MTASSSKSQKKRLDGKFILESYFLHHVGTKEQLSELKERARDEGKTAEEGIAAVLSTGDRFAAGALLYGIGRRFPPARLAAYLMLSHGTADIVLQALTGYTAVGLMGERVVKPWLDGKWPEFSDDFSWVSDGELLEDILLSESAMSAIPYRGIHSQQELEEATSAIYPVLEQVCGEAALCHPTAEFMPEEQAEWVNSHYPKGTSFSQSTSFIINPLLMSTDTEERLVHPVVSHELCHCLSSNEAATQLRGLEVDARLSASDENHRFGFFANLNYWAAVAALLKDIEVGVDAGLRELAESTVRGYWQHRGSDFKDIFEERADSLIAGEDTYPNWAYSLTPYKAFRQALAADADTIEAPQPTARPDRLSWINASVCMGMLMRKLSGDDEKERPLELSASLCLYREAREGYALAQEPLGKDGGQA